jgi:hypothetical protein
VGLLNNIQLLGSGGLISVVTARSLQGDVCTIHSVSGSSQESPLAIESQH